MMCLLFALLLSLLMASPIFAGSGGLELAQKQIEDGKYSEALALYKNELMVSGENGAIYYNMSNAAYRLGKLGQAIFYLHKAHQLLPGQGDIVYNLNFLRAKTVDKIASKKSWFVIEWERIPFTYKHGWQLFALFSVFAWGASLFLLYRKNQEWIRWVKAFSIMALIVISGAILLKWSQNSSFGVVVAPEAKIYSAIGRDNVVLFTLHEGAEFEVTDVRDQEWTRIALADGKSGWVRGQDILKDSGS